MDAASEQAKQASKMRQHILELNKSNLKENTERLWGERPEAFAQNMSAALVYDMAKILGYKVTGKRLKDKAATILALSYLDYYAQTQGREE